RAEGDSERHKRARVLFVFSDRTKAAWDVLERKNLQALANQVPPAFERLAGIRGGIPELLKLLPDLRQQVPQLSSQDEQVLTDRLQKLAERIPQVRAETYPDAETTSLVLAVRSKEQELMALLYKSADTVSEEARGYRDKLQTAVANSLRASAGFTGFFVDVGIEKPSDLALRDFQLVRPFDGKSNQVQHQLQVYVQATGEGYDPTVFCEVDGVALAPMSPCPPVTAGQRELVAFDIDKHLEPGFHQARVFIKSSDALANNNSRYLTYAVRPVLLLTDKPADERVAAWAKAIEANQLGAALYRCEIKTPEENLLGRAAGALDRFAAVYLCSLTAPDPKLWEHLKDYASKGGGVAVFPPGQADDQGAYASASALENLPAKLAEV